MEASSGQVAGCFSRPLRRRAASLGRRSPRRGFTLIELLVVVAVVSILMAILIPALSSARRIAMSTKSMSQCRDHAMAIISAAAQSDDKFPTAERTGQNFLPGGPLTRIRRQWTDSSDENSDDYSFIAWFGADSMWPMILYNYFGYDRMESLLSPTPVRFESLQGNRTNVMQSDYKVTHAVLATPRFFEQGFTQMENLGQCQAQRLSSAKHSSRKVLIYENVKTANVRMPTRVYDDPRTPLILDGAPDVLRPVTFIDGHAEQRYGRDASPFVPNNVAGMSIDPRDEACLTTENGLRAYDF
jgi:prepilin-type N-terminal cleavage/methylation domain-containing protein